MEKLDACSQENTSKAVLKFAVGIYMNVAHERLTWEDAH